MPDVLDEDPDLAPIILAYIGALYHELTQENAYPPVGTQNQLADAIRADPALAAYMRRWAAANPALLEASLEPPQALPGDAVHDRLAALLRATMPPPIFIKQGNS
jgi:hypothetical protein